MLRILFFSAPAMLFACAPDADSFPTTAPDNQTPADTLSYGEDALVIDFGDGAENDWYSVNDTVMGGVSSGSITFSDESMVFEGEVSTANNGGFASVRSPQEFFDLSSYSRVLIRLRSEGQPFSMIMAHNEWWFEDQFKHDIVVSDDDWSTIEIPFSEFLLFTFDNGYPTETDERMTPQDTEQVFHIELMSKLFEDGPFRLEVDYIAID